MVWVCFWGKKTDEDVRISKILNLCPFASQNRCKKPKNIENSLKSLNKVNSPSRSPQFDFCLYKIIEYTFIYCLGWYVMLGVYSYFRVKKAQNRCKKPKYIENSLKSHNILHPDLPNLTNSLYKTIECNFNAPPCVVFWTFTVILVCK